jgi:hypothetical protein
VVTSFVDSHYQHSFPDRGLLAKEILTILGKILFSDQYASVSDLTDALAKFKITGKSESEQPKLVTLITDLKTDKEILVITLPEVRKASADIKDNSAFYINFAKSILLISDENIRICFDSNLGNVVKLPNSVKDCCDMLLKAARSSSGLVGAKTLKTEAGFKGPLPAMLCALRTLNRNLHLYRKTKSKACNLQSLKSMIDTEFGFTLPGSDPFVKSFIRQTLALATSVLNRSFPASYYACAKSENNVKTTEGLLAVLGYIQITPSVNKCLKISQVTFKVNEKGQPLSYEKIDQDKELPQNTEFHMAVKCLLPLIKKSDSEKISDQLKNPEKFLSESSRVLYKTHSSDLDLLIKAYAFFSASHSKKKTKLVHVQNAIGHASRQIVEKMPYQDAEGKTYASYMDIRYTYRAALEKLLKRRRSPKKRKSDEKSTSDQPTPKPKRQRGKSISSQVKDTSVLMPESGPPDDAEMETT